MTVSRSRTYEWLRRFANHTASPAVIGAIVAFMATHAIGIWQDRQRADEAFWRNQELKDNDRIDEIRKAVHVTADTCEEVKKQTNDFANAFEGLRTKLGRREAVPIQDRLNDKRKLCAIYAALEKMPKNTSADIGRKIVFCQNSISEVTTTFGATELADKIRVLRDIEKSALESERQDEIRRKNEALAQQAANEAAQLTARRAAVDAALAAERARREADDFNRILQRSFKIAN